MSERPKVGDVWYRYDFMRWAPTLNEYDEPNGNGRRSVELRQYTVLRVTPKGVWVDDNQFVLKRARKRLCYPTKELARESFIARKRRHIMLLEGQLHDARLALQLIGEADQRQTLPMEIVQCPNLDSLL